jgi:hypothetical protein
MFQDTVVGFWKIEIITLFFIYKNANFPLQNWRKSWS